MVGDSEGKEDRHGQTHRDTSLGNMSCRRVLQEETMKVKTEPVVDMNELDALLINELHAVDAQRNQMLICEAEHAVLCRCWREHNATAVMAPTLFDRWMLHRQARRNKTGRIGTGLSQWLAKKLGGKT